MVVAAGVPALITWTGSPQKAGRGPLLGRFLKVWVGTRQGRTCRWANKVGGGRGLGRGGGGQLGLPKASLVAWGSLSASPCFLNFRSYVLRKPCFTTVVIEGNKHGLVFHESNESAIAQKVGLGSDFLDVTSVVAPVP